MEHTRTIDFYWEVGSTNSYFALHLLRPVAERHGAAIRYIPINLGHVFRHHNYVLMDEPKKEKPTAHQGTERPPRKKASVLFWRRANQPPMKTISTR